MTFGVSQYEIASLVVATKFEFNFAENQVNMDDKKKKALDGLS